MSEEAQFIGGPHDGERMTIPEILYCIMTPARFDLGAMLRESALGGQAPEPEASRHGVYELRLDGTGHPSRTDAGQLRYDWKGEQ